MTDGDREVECEGEILHQLFIVTDYERRIIEIPVFDDNTHETSDPKGSTEEEQQQTATLQKTITVELVCSPQASTDWDLTGQILWPVSMLLSYYLASKAGQDKVRGKTVVELGAGGTGLPGFVAAHSKALEVVLTDGNGDVVLDMLQQNVSIFQQNRESSSKSTTASCYGDARVSAAQLVWGHREQTLQIRKSLSESSSAVDVVVAADVVQWPDVVEPLLHTVKALLWSSKHDKPLFLLGIVNRANKTYQLFFRLAKHLGFSVARIPLDTFLKDGMVPSCCQEYGGRTTELYEVSLTDRSHVPVLLHNNQQQQETQDWTAGSNYD